MCDEVFDFWMLTKMNCKLNEFYSYVEKCIILTIRGLPDEWHKSVHIKKSTIFKNMKNLCLSICLNSKIGKKLNADS